ncbi:hypothetical protein COO60DRAFT_1478607 [Scenedesmus sp. NREL 46B-D3]|nr:hypothetical protein COO60DRAFT_1478607 [Scenedesmus sp. NREL 46B-D3]
MHNSVLFSFHKTFCKKAHSRLWSSNACTHTHCQNPRPCPAGHGTANTVKVWAYFTRALSLLTPHIHMLYLCKKIVTEHNTHQAGAVQKWLCWQRTHKCTHKSSDTHIDVQPLSQTHEPSLTHLCGVCALQCAHTTQGKQHPCTLLTYEQQQPFAVMRGVDWAASVLHAGAVSSHV